MGNHDAGKAMGLAAEAAMLTRPKEGGPTALSILDTICEPWRGCDAEFEATDPKRPGRIHPDYANYTDLPAPMAVLMLEAFAPNGLKDREKYEKHDKDGDLWWNEVREKFSQRYELC